MLKSADEKLYEIGFRKVEETNVQVNRRKTALIQYERENKEYNFIQCLTICGKESGGHIVQSYVKTVNSEGFNNVVGLTGYEMKLILKKMKEMGLEIKRKSDA